MKKREKEKLLLIALFLLLFAVNYPFLDKALKNWLVDYEIGVVERVVDGDTLIVNGSNVRLLGINTPEKGELYYEEAKIFLENLTLHKFVKLEMGKENLDKYDRKLRYILIGDENINLEIVKEGYANFYFPSGKDRYYKEFKEAWENCIPKNINLCEKSQDKCSDCIILKDLNVKSQEVTLYNKCQFQCELSDWQIKNEGRKVFVFPDFDLAPNKNVKIVVGNESNTKDVLFWKEYDYIWIETGDTIFLRDNKEKLVFWWGY